MQEFHPEALVERIGFLDAMTTVALVQVDLNDGMSPALDEGTRTSTLTILSDLEPECAAIDLRASLVTIKRLRLFLRDPKPDWGELRNLLRELIGRLRDELSETVFLSLTTREAGIYKLPRKDWSDTVTRFPSVIRDVEEAAKCLALGRNTACVFHLMRIAEGGLRTLGKALNDPTLDPRTNPTWDKILKRCDRELAKPHNERSPEWVTAAPFFATATANLRAIKDAWRNTTLHVDQHYDEEEAREIYGAVRAFMRHLSTKLAEGPSQSASDIPGEPAG